MSAITDRLFNARDWARRNMPHAAWLQNVLFDAENEIHGLHVEVARLSEAQRVKAERATQAKPSEPSHGPTNLAEWHEEMKRSRSI